MNISRSEIPYSLIEIPLFDARSGLSRCSPPGIGASVQGYPNPIADFWRSPSGSIMLRVTLRKERRAFEARLASGKPIQERNFEKFAWFVSRQILRWATCIDEEPFDEISFPMVVTRPSDTYWLARLLVLWMEFHPFNRSPEIVRELLPELGSIKTIESIADAPNVHACLCLFIDQIVEAKTKANRKQKTAKTEINRKAAATAARRLSAVEAQLMDFLADIGTKQSPIKAVEMSERESIMWDNDPHAGREIADELV